MVMLICHPFQSLDLQSCTSANFTRQFSRNVTARSSVKVSSFFGKKAPQVSEAKPCKKCKSKGSLTCPSCKGTGKNKKNGNVFERWKCYDCQGFGLISCPECGGKGLTPEQRGER